MKEDHISRTDFLLEIFGPLGREFGDPVQYFTDDPTEILTFVEECAKEKKPAFISVQPRTKHHAVYGIEKIFYDFDYGKKSDKLTEKQIERHKTKLEIEIRIFVVHLVKLGIRPMIVKTRKGYHVHIFFDKIYEIDNDEEYWREVYGALYDRFIENNKHTYKYADSTSRNDIFRLCRIPTSIHEKSGKECILLDTNFKPTKLRSLNYYKSYGLRARDFAIAIGIATANKHKKELEKKEYEKNKKEKWEVEHGYVGTIRKCFQARMDAGEMCHQQRLAMLIEAWYSGKKTRPSMIDFFRWANDFDGDRPQSTCRTQVNWFFDNKVDEKKQECAVKPYRCDTIRKHGWCLYEECPTFIKQKEKGKIGKTKRKKA